MRIRILLLVLLVILCQQLRAQFTEYHPLPILPRTQQRNSPPQSVEEKVLADRKRRMELEVLKEQRDLLRNLNTNNASSTSNNLITFNLSGASTSDLQFNPKSDWTQFTQGSTIKVNNAANLVKFDIPDMNQSFITKVLNLKVEEEDDHSINTLELEEGHYISVLNVYKENGLWIIWGTKGDPELVIFQSSK